MKTITSSLALLALLCASTGARKLNSMHTSRDAYDLDPHTVSPYDAMEQHAYLPKYDEDFGVDFNPAKFDGVQTGFLAQRAKRSRDNYDNDPNTVSPYDAMEQHQHLDKYDKTFGTNQFEGVQIGVLMREIKAKNNGKRDNYDGDKNTVSPYDAMEQHAPLGKYDDEAWADKNEEFAQIRN